MDRELAALHRGAQRERAALVPDPEPAHVGKTLPQQVEGDHAYRDDPPRHDPGGRFRCAVCGAGYDCRGRRLVCCSDAARFKAPEAVEEGR